MRIHPFKRPQASRSCENVKIVFGLIRGVIFRKDCVNGFFKRRRWCDASWKAELAVDDMGDTWMVIWEVLARHNELAPCALNEQVPEIVAGETLHN